MSIPDPTRRALVQQGPWGGGEDEAFPEIDGRSRVMRRLKVDMFRVARDPFVTVLILGQSGTGKERVARAIHRASPRQHAPFVVVNCAGLAASLVEDELFGHVRGAFTGAVADRAGPFERANGGTVFLDEIGELTPELQIKLLRALQQRTVQRLGGRQELEFDVRVIAATNVDLVRARAEGRFREDLYFRLKVYELRVPPLRRRGVEDIALLSTAILARLCERRGHRPPDVGADVFAAFAEYEWPGNVRELENTLECMIVRAGCDGVLTARHLPADVAAQRRGSATGGGAGAGDPALWTADVLRTALDAHGWHRGRTAAAFGISRHQLYRLQRLHGVRRE